MSDAPHDPRPTIGITMGDPGGIGAEVVVKALADRAIRSLARYVVFGLNELMAYVADSAEIETYWWRDQHERFAAPGGPGGGILPGGGASYPHDVVVLDYDDPDNPSAIRMIHDEVRAIGPDTFLGGACLKGTSPRLVLWFALRRAFGN